jgi:polyisoprenoid-binding protein YceI
MCMNIKRIAFVLYILLITKVASAQYKPTDQGSELKFTIGNFGFDVNGSFTGLQGSISFDPENPTKSSFDVTIDANSINTDNNMRDEHLRSESYFDVKNYPRIRMLSTKVSGPSKNGSYIFTGQLTIKGKPKEVSFPFTATASSDGFLFKGTFKINRKDFDIGGVSTISNELEVSLNILAKKA